MKPLPDFVISPAARNVAWRYDLLTAARRRLYEIAKGHIDSNNVEASSLTTEERMAFFRTPEFVAWVEAERASGHQVFWLKDVDKTQAAGDIFTFFYKWRADNKKFSPSQLKTIEDFLLSRMNPVERAAFKVARRFTSLDRLSPYEVIRLWQSKEHGGPGISLLDFWSKIYWPTQIGLTKEEKESQVREFAPHYAKKVYPGVPEENRLLEELGVNVVIVSNGDHELALAVSGILGIKPENVVGSRLVYGKDGRATGCLYSYELFDEEWSDRPQPGKPLSFHYWAHVNRKRLGLPHLSDEQIVVAGRDGDSASADGGMMILLSPPAIGNFMVDTPGEPGRLKKFFELAARYGWTRGQFFTLRQLASKSGAVPE